MNNFDQLLLAFLRQYIQVGQTTIDVNINFNSLAGPFQLGVTGQTPGFIVEEAISQLFDLFFNNWAVTNTSAILGQNIQYNVNNNANIHRSLHDPFDFVFVFTDANTQRNHYCMVDSKTAAIGEIPRTTRNQRNQRGNQNAYVISTRYTVASGTTGNTITITDLQVQTLDQAFTSHLIRDSKQYYNLKGSLNENLKIENLKIDCNKNISLTISKRLKSLGETIKYLKDSNSLLEAKKRIQVKKFIEQNFTKRGDYVFPKDGNSKCSLHQEYDKGLLRFFADHGITKIMSAYGNDVPSLGYSDSEKKWYGWSHRAIYGFKVGDKIKKGTCGYEEMKKKGLLNIKTEDQAKEVAKIFAEDVS